MLHHLLKISLLKKDFEDLSIVVNIQTAIEPKLVKGYTIPPSLKDYLPPSANYENGVGIPNGAVIPRGAKFGTYDIHGILTAKYVADGSSEIFTFESGSTIDINEFKFTHGFPIDNTDGNLNFETVNEFP